MITIDNLSYVDPQTLSIFKQFLAAKDREIAELKIKLFELERLHESADQEIQMLYSMYHEAVETR